MHALITGTMHRAPELRTAKSGKPYVHAGLRTADGWVNVTAFAATVQAELLRLGEGESVTLQGELKVGSYVDKAGETKPLSISVE
jgi:single-stranded DNA-binding protein